MDAGWRQHANDKLSSATAERPTFDAPDELLTDLTLTFSLTVSDGMNTSAAADTVVITITAGPNDPPIVEAGNPQTVGEGASVTLTGSGTDPEGQILTFLWTQVDTSTVSLTNPTMTTATFTAPTQLVNNVLYNFPSNRNRTERRAKRKRYGGNHRNRRNQ